MALLDVVVGDEGGGVADAAASASCWPRFEGAAMLTHYSIVSGEN